MSIPRFEERLRSLCQRKGRPVMHGEIALEVCCSLNRVDIEMAPLLEFGSFRLVTVAELKSLSMSVRVIAYTLVM